MREYKYMDSENRRIYLDHAAATPARSEVVGVLEESLSLSANPASVHKEGMMARSAIRDARKSMVLTLGALPHEVIFTSGSTESLNIAIQGVFKKFKDRFESPHIVTSIIEHPSVLETLRALEGDGLQVTYLVPDKYGVIQEKELKESLRTETVLVVFSYVNGEIGNVLPVDSVMKVLRSFKRHQTGERYPYFLLDATQAARSFKLSVQKLGVDMLALDGSKIGGLKGAGLLYLHRDVEIRPILFGGGQEEGLRPGTSNLLALKSLSVALSLSQEEVEGEGQRQRKLSEFFIEKLESNFPRIVINGDRDNRAPHIVSVCFPGVDAEWLVLMLDAHGVSVSRGSACKSGKGNESEVLSIIDSRCAESSVRFSFGRETNEGELERVIDILVKVMAEQPVESFDSLA